MRLFLINHPFGCRCYKTMRMTLRILLAVGLLFSCLASAQESNDSLEILTNAEARVNLRLEQFAKTNTDYELLLEAQKISASLNPRGDNKLTLSQLDERCLRLQLKILLALNMSRDSHYDRNAETNRVYLNVMPPLTKAPGPYMAGMDPNAIKDPEARKTYEDAIAENNRRNEKLKREMALSRGVDYALIDVWVFVKRGLPEHSSARDRAIEIVAKTISDKSLLERFNASDMPGLIW